MNNDSKKALKIVLIVIGSIIGGLFLIGALAPIIVILLIKGGDHALHEYVENRDEAAAQKTMTTYYEEGEIVSARYFYKEDGERVWVDIPEDQVDDLVDELDTLTIRHVGGMKDYFYGWVNGIELTYESGNYIQFDGEQIRYFHAGSSERDYQIYMYFEEGYEPFWDILSEYTEDGRVFHSPFYQPDPEDVSGG